MCMSGVSLASGLFVKFSASLELVGRSYMRLTSLSDPSAKQFSCACSLTFSIISFNFDSEQAFEQFGEIEEGAVITDKGTGKSRGFGFITFKHMDSAQRALREPSKNIDVSSTVNAEFFLP